MLKKFLVSLALSSLIFNPASAEIKNAETSGENMNKSQREFLIAKYEQDLNILDFDRKINWQTIYETSQKLAELDANNPAAFRAKIYYFREQGYWSKAVDLCNEVLNKNPPADILIEAYTLLGDMNYNEYGNKAEAKKFIDAGIALVKKTYSKAEIEKFVNGMNVQLKDLELVGKSNAIRELYVLKSEIEDCNPTFKEESKMHDLELDYDRIYDLKYKTDW